MGILDHLDLPSEPPKPTQKPPRGTYRLERDKLRAERKAAEDAVIAAHKAWANYRCRWPEAHRCRGGLEGAHMRAKGQGGDKLLERTTIEQIVSLCAWVHRTGPETLEHHELKIEAETPQGTLGPLSFWRRGEGFDQANQPVYEMVAREVRPFQVERD